MPVPVDGGRKTADGKSATAGSAQPSGWRGFWRRVLGWFGLRPPIKHRSEGYSLLAMDAGLDAFMRDLAAQEQRPVEEITADLLARGLVQRGLDEQLARRWAHLSPRERQVAALSCLGYTNGQIAVRLGVSRETVKTYSNIAQHKFDVRSKADLRRVLDGWDFSEFDE